MKIEEAKQKKCPIRNSFEPQRVDDGKVAYDQVPCNCLGDECMLWRYYVEPADDEVRTIFGPIQSGKVKLSTTDGCCGLGLAQSKSWA